MGNIYIGVNNIAKEIKSAYIGVDGIARKIKAIYVGVDNVAKLVWSAVKTKFTTYISSKKHSISYTDYDINYSFNVYYTYDYFRYFYDEVVDLGNNLFATMIRKRYQGDNDDKEILSLMAFQLDSTGAITKRWDIECYTFYDISGAQYSVGKLVKVGEGVLYLPFEYCVFTSEYSEYTYYGCFFNLNSNNYKLITYGSDTSKSRVMQHYHPVGLGNNCVAFLDYRHSSSTYYLTKVSYASNTYSVIGSVIVPSTHFSPRTIMGIEKLDDNHLLIFEYNSNTSSSYGLYLGTIDSQATGVGITITDLGTFTLSMPTGNVYIQKIDNNNFLLYKPYCMQLLTIDNNYKVTIGELFTVPSDIQSIAYCYYPVRIGTSTTFACAFNTNVAYLIYVDLSKKTIEYLGKKTVGSRDHSYSDTYLAPNCAPFQDDGIVTFNISTGSNSSAFAANSYIATFE